MASIHDPTILTAENIERVRAELSQLAPEQADSLQIGCRTWCFENADGFSGRITIWPDGGRGALASEAANHWGFWDTTQQRLILDNGDIYGPGGDVGEDA